MSEPARIGAPPKGDKRKSESIRVPVEKRDKDRLNGIARKMEKYPTEVARLFILRGLDDAEKPAKA